MKLTFKSDSWFPFAVPEKDATFASSVGPQTVYPAGFTLERALQIYWRAKNYALVAAGSGSDGGLTQALTVNQNLPPRNAGVGTNSFYEVDGFTPVGPGDLVTGYGLRQVIPGAGTITAGAPAGSGTNPSAQFNLQVNLFYPEIFAPDPVVRYAGKWWPAMSVSCAVSNTVELDGGGELSIAFSCDSYNPSSTIAVGTFSFFGASVPVFCASLDSGETRTFSGSLSVADEWP
jgi:hypothetical protein